MLNPHFSIGAHFIGGVKYIILFKDTIILGHSPSGEFTELNKLKFLKIPLPAAIKRVFYKKLESDRSGIISYNEFNIDSDTNAEFLRTINRDQQSIIRVSIPHQEDMDTHSDITD